MAVREAAALLPFNSVHPVDNLSKQVPLHQGVHHGPQLGIEDSGHDIWSVEGTLALLQRVDNVHPAGVGGEGEEESWLAKDSHYGHRVHELLDVPPR